MDGPESATEEPDAEGIDIKEQPPSSADVPVSLPAFPQEGITIAALRRFLATHGHSISDEMTTSTVCHTIIKPLTVPAGWADEATLINPKKGWYAHKYRNLATNAVQNEPPSDTKSYAQLLLADSDEGVRAGVGRANVFFSHAWGAQFKNVVEAMASLVASLPPAEQELTYIWFDTFCIDEHATQSFPQEWWSTTFKDAIRAMGHTAMMLSPWYRPVTLTRAWCLWELYCTAEVSAKFSVCFGPAEKASFEETIVKDLSSISEALAAINVADAEAGSPDDLDMIMRAVVAAGGPSRLNSIAMTQIRSWIQTTAVSMLDERTATDGAIAPGCHSLAKTVASVLDGQGRTIEAISIMRRAIESCTQFNDGGGNNTATLNLQQALANMLRGTDIAEAQQIQEHLLRTYSAFFGPDHGMTATAKQQLATTLQHRGTPRDMAEARRLLSEVLAHASAAKGPGALATADVEGRLAALLYEIAAVGNGGATEARQARQLYETAIGKHTEMLGPRHEDTLTLQCNYATLLENLFGETDAAIAVRQRCVEGFTEQKGEDHPTTVSVIENLAISYQSRGADGDGKVVIELCERVVKLRIHSVGIFHAATLQAQDSLASQLVANGSSEEAVLLLRSVVAQWVEQGEHAIGTYDAKHKLGKLLVMLRGEASQDEAARELFEDVVAGYVAAVGPIDRRTLQAQDSLAGLFFKQYAYTDDKTIARAFANKAAGVFRDVVAGFQDVMGVTHLDALMAQLGLVGALEGAEEYEEAEAVIADARFKLDAKFGQDHQMSRNAKSIADSLESKIANKNACARQGKAAWDQATTAAAFQITGNLHAPYDGLYKLVAEHDSFPYFQSQNGRHLFRHVPTGKWYLRQKFEPDSASRLSEIAAPDGPVPVGSQSWTTWNGKADVEVALVVTAVSREELAAEEDAKRAAAAVVTQAARDQASTVAAFRITGNLHAPYDGLYKLAADLESNLNDGFPHYVTGSGKHLFRHVPTGKWFMKQKFEPDSASRLSEIAAPDGPVPVGSQSWTTWNGKADVQVVLVVISMIEEELIVEEATQAAVKRAAAVKEVEKQVAQKVAANEQAARIGGLKFLELINCRETFTVDVTAPLANGYPHYSNTSGKHLYHHQDASGSGKWLISATFTPDKLAGTAYVAANGAVAVGETSWTICDAAASTKKWVSQVVVVVELSNEELASEVEANRAAMVAQAHAARDQASRVAALRMEGHLNSTAFDGLYTIVAEHDGFPHYQNENGKYLYRHVPTGKWYLKAKFEPELATRVSEIAAPDGPVPMGIQIWTTWNGKTDVRHQISVTSDIQTAAVATAGVQNAEELYNLAATNRFEGDCKNESESEPKAESS